MMYIYIHMYIYMYIYIHVYVPESGEAARKPVLAPENKGAREVVDALKVHEEPPAFVVWRQRMRPPDVEVEGLGHLGVQVVTHHHIRRGLVGAPHLHAVSAESLAVTAVSHAVTAVSLVGALSCACAARPRRSFRAERERERDRES